MYINDSQKIFIAHVRMQNPYGYKSNSPFRELMETAIHFGDWIGIDVDFLWGGSIDIISYVSHFTDKPIVAIGLFSTDKKIRDCVNDAASYVMTPRIPDFNNVHSGRLLLELNNDVIRDLICRDKNAARYMYVHNTRDLRTGQMKDPALLHEFMNLDIRHKIQASNIKSPADVHPNATHFIVGEGLVEFCSKL